MHISACWQGQGKRGGGRTHRTGMWYRADCRPLRQQGFACACGWKLYRESVSGAVRCYAVLILCDISALDAMRKAHETEVQREIVKFKNEFIKKMQSTHDIGALHKEHDHGSQNPLAPSTMNALPANVVSIPSCLAAQPDVGAETSLPRKSSGFIDHPTATRFPSLLGFRQAIAEMEEIKKEILSLSERYSVKCVESAALEEQLAMVTKQLTQAQQHIQQLDARIMKALEILRPVTQALAKLEADTITLSDVPQECTDISIKILLKLKSAQLSKVEETKVEEIIKDRIAFMCKPIHLSANLLDSRYHGNVLSDAQSSFPCNQLYKFHRNCLQDLEAAGPIRKKNWRTGKGLVFHTFAGVSFMLVKQYNLGELIVEVFNGEGQILCDQLNKQLRAHLVSEVSELETGDTAQLLRQRDKELVKKQEELGQLQRELNTARALSNEHTSRRDRAALWAHLQKLAACPPHTTGTTHIRIKGQDGDTESRPYSGWVLGLVALRQGTKLGSDSVIFRLRLCALGIIPGRRVLLVLGPAFGGTCVRVGAEGRMLSMSCSCQWGQSNWCEICDGNCLRLVQLAEVLSEPQVYLLTQSITSGIRHLEFTTHTHTNEAKGRVCITLQRVEPRECVQTERSPYFSALHLNAVNTGNQASPSTVSTLGCSFSRVFPIQGMSPSSIGSAVENGEYRTDKLV
ncbi:hypothetical protein PR048_009582 [Dryococelus australis]|uniref:Uncharacterized protein n=1 Tax=Dryococelus australis TaxID=614101 RepID=A0ABQ9I099_9NEOP|nr:hypothetical protein PR048_009582 [Dryococelus australis]